jgi:hypothetical protein
MSLKYVTRKLEDQSLEEEVAAAMTQQVREPSQADSQRTYSARRRHF